MQNKETLDVSFPGPVESAPPKDVVEAKMPFVIYALAASTFAIGTTEFVIVGLIPGIAEDLHVSLPTAGLLVSLYALSITLGTPILAVSHGVFFGVGAAFIASIVPKEKLMRDANRV
jgi:predicted MFS family arabinose efflux permease